jgi:hypothetical protein
MVAAATFCSTCSGEPEPGIGRICGDLASSQVPRSALASGVVLVAAHDQDPPTAHTGVTTALFG